MGLPVEQTKLDLLTRFGPWMASLVGLTLMVGIIMAQSTRYFSMFGFESRWMLSVVVISLGLIITQWIAVVDLAWFWFITHFGDYDGTGEGPWQGWFAPLIGQAAVFTAQLFFAHRCYSLWNGNKFIFIGLITGTFTTLALFAIPGTLGRTGVSSTDTMKLLTPPAYAINLLTDLAIAGLTLWKLGDEGGQSYCPNTDDVLRRLRNLTIEAAVPPAICSTVSICLFFAWGREKPAFLPFVTLTPTLYVSSLLFTLNSRQSIRRRLNAPNDQGFPGGGHELSIPLESGDKASSRQRVDVSSCLPQPFQEPTIIFAPTTDPTYAPNASTGREDERTEGSEGYELRGRKSSSIARNEPT